MTTIKVNNKTITIANKSNESLSFNDLDKESKSLESLALNIEKSVEALNIVSNIKAIESFGYKSTEGVGENIKKGAIAVKNKIIEWFKKLMEFFKNLQAKILANKLIPNDTLNNSVKLLLNSFHEYAKKNIEAISKVEGEEIAKYKTNQQKCNLLRQYTLYCIKLVSPKILGKEAVKSSNGEISPENLVEIITNSNSFSKLCEGVNKFIQYANSSLMSNFENDKDIDIETFTSKLENFKSKLDAWKQSLMNEIKASAPKVQQTQVK